jgi:5-methylcytosine-specific restriction protein A
MPKLRTLRPLVRTFHGGALKPQGKRVDPIYTSDVYQLSRDGVIARAGGRCEAMENGERCRKARPEHRLFADHITEQSLATVALPSIQLTASASAVGITR